MKLWRITRRSYLTCGILAFGFAGHAAPTAEFVLSPGREMGHLSRLGHRQVGLQVMMDDLVEGRLLRPPTPVDGGRREAGA